jgi:hypothetical protein
VIRKPAQLVEAELVLGICERFGQLPSAVLAEDARLLQYLNIERAYREQRGDDVG